MFRSNVLPANLPNDWHPKQLQDIARIHGGGRLGLTKADYVGRGTCAYSAAGQDGCVEVTEGDVPSIILSSIGARCGKSFLTSGPWTTLANTQVITPDQKIADASYLIGLLDNEDYWNRSGSAQPFIKPSDVKCAWVPLPPLDEQRRIAKVLHSVDDAVAAKRATVTATKQFKRTCREAAVLRFKDCASTAMRGVLASIDAGWSPDCESEPANDGEWSILRTSSVVWQGYDDNENKRLPAHLEPRPNLEVNVDDILITRAGPAERTGVVAIVRETAGRRMLSDKIIRLRVSPKEAVPLAIAELLSSDHVQAELIRSKSGMAASQTNISQKIVLGLQMYLPSLADQRDFADEMAALQDAIEMGEAEYHDARRLKAALMSDLLSGRVRVPA